jgi:hypothetical protein
MSRMSAYLEQPFGVIRLAGKRGPCKVPSTPNGITTVHVRLLQWMTIVSAHFK